MRGDKPKSDQLSQWKQEFGSQYGSTVGAEVSGRYKPEETSFINEWHNKGIPAERLAIVLGRPAAEVKYKLRTDAACCMDCNVPDPENGKKWCWFAPRGRRPVQKRQRKDGPGSHYNKSEKALIERLHNKGKSKRYILKRVKETRPATTLKSLKGMMRRLGLIQPSRSRRPRKTNGIGRQFRDGHDRIELIENGNGRKRYVVSRDTFEWVRKALELDQAA
jgi:hypothetical protein